VHCCRLQSMSPLLNPTNPTISTAFVRQLEPAARVMGFQLHWLKASTDRDLDEAFAALAKLHADALVIGPDTFFNSRAKRAHPAPHARQVTTPAGLVGSLNFLAAI
jgi:hypothetical protein